MAHLSAACRLSVRLVRRRLPSDAPFRGFRTAAAALAAQNFTMPALSPTMTEGNIASWRVKEGEKFAAGDVLLEIETDKATMDVEAQEDGILMKIMHGDGSRGVQVGTRIAVVAEEGDDISSLQIPAEESIKKATPTEPEAISEPLAQSSSSQSASQKSPTKAHDKAPKQHYPLLPSVMHLLHENGLDDNAANDITPTGPNGRLVKGDVLAYLGKINADAPAGNMKHFEKAAHLDLSNIKVATPKPAQEDKATEKATKMEPSQEMDLVAQEQISFDAVISLQKKTETALGAFVPLSTFLERAIDVANDALPLPENVKSTAEELFDEVLGFGPIHPKSSRGSYVPVIKSPPPKGTALSMNRPARVEEDIIDILSRPAGLAVPKKTTTATLGISTGLNDFTLIVPKPEARRAQTFLARLKTVLENEPGRLIL